MAVGHRLHERKNAVRVSDKRNADGAQVKSGIILHPKIVGFEIGDGSDEESVALRSGIRRVKAGKPFLSSDYPERTLKEFGLSELEMMS